MTRRAQTGRAELLRALALGADGPLTLDAHGAVWFGFAPEEKRRAPAVEGAGVMVMARATGGMAPQESDADEETLQPPLQMDTIWAVVEHTEIPGDEAPTDPIPQVEPITEDEAKARCTERQFEFEDLVPWARLTPVLRQRLAKSHRAGVDMVALCRAVARQQPLRHHLPQHTRTRWHPDLVVALDFSPRLWPYRWDMHRLCAQLRRQCGRHGVSLRILSNGPWGQWTGWRGDAGPDDAVEFEARDWVMPAAGSRLLIVGDLGRLSPGGAMEPAWRGFVEDALAAGVQVEALVPLGAGQVSAEWAARLPVIRWSQDSALRPERGEAPTDDAHDSDFQALMAMVAGLRRVDPPLLRALRRLLPGQHGNAGFEGLVWSHADVRPSMAVEILPEAAVGWLDHYRERLAPELLRAHQTLRRQHHAHLRAALNHEEVLLHAAHAGADVGAVSAVEVEVSEQFLARVACWVGDTGTHVAPASWQTFASDAVRRTDPRTAQRFAGVYTDLLAADLVRRGVTRLEGEDLPVWVESARLLGRLALPQGRAPRCWLVEDMRRRCIQLQTAPPGRLQRRLSEPLDVGHVLVGEVGDGGGQRLLKPSAAVVPLCSTDRGRALVIQAGRQRLVISPVRRPSGMEGWSFGATPLEVSDEPILRLLMSGGQEKCIALGDLAFYCPPNTVDRDRRFHLLMPREGYKEVDGRRSGVSKEKTVFISYSHHDRESVELLLGILDPLCRASSSESERWSIWVETNPFKAEEDWLKGTDEGLRDASLFIVVLSHAYQFSQYLMTKELPGILKRYVEEDVPVLGLCLHSLRITDFSVTLPGDLKMSMQNFQCMPYVSDGSISGDIFRPVSRWASQNDAWDMVATNINQAWPYITSFRKRGIDAEDLADGFGEDRLLEENAKKPSAQQKSSETGFGARLWKRLSVWRKK